MDGVKDNHGSPIRVKIVQYSKNDAYCTWFHWTLGVFFCFNNQLGNKKTINRWEGEVAGYTNSILGFTGSDFQEQYLKISSAIIPKWEYYNLYRRQSTGNMCLIRELIEQRLGNGWAYHTHTGSLSWWSASLHKYLFLTINNILLWYPHNYLLFSLKICTVSRALLIIGTLCFLSIHIWINSRFTCTEIELNYAIFAKWFIWLFLIPLVYNFLQLINSLAVELFSINVC